jgi:hypothetical protein
MRLSSGSSAHCAAFAVLTVLLLAAGGGSVAAESRLDLSRPVPTSGELLAAAEVSGALAPGLYDRDFGYDVRPGSVGGTYRQIGLGVWAGYGITDAIALGLDFSPGGIIISRYVDGEYRRRGRVSDLVLSGRFEIWGDDGLAGAGRLGQAPLEVGLSPRVIIAMPAPDYAQAAENRFTGENYIAVNQDLHAWGGGIEIDAAARVGSDWTLRTAHQLDLFLPSDYDSASLAAYEENELRESLSTVEPFDTIWYRYRYRGAFGADWRVTDIWDLQPITLEAEYLPPPIIDDLDPLSDTDTLLLRAGIGAEARIRRSDGKPPFVFRGAYYAPILGKNADAEHLLILSMAFKLL